MLTKSSLLGIGLASSGSVLAACGGGSSGGPGGGTGGDQGDAATGKGGAVTWASWANPGEAERFREVSKDYTAANETKVTYQIVTGDYNAKLLTQLAGGSAPDAFYISTEGMAKLIESKNLIDLTEFAGTADSPVKIDAFYPGLLPWCKTPTGEGIYGLPVDCNPLVFWFNKDMVAAAGITENPQQKFEAGTWNRDALDEFLTAIKASGKRGLVLEGGWAAILSWLTTFGGTTFDESNKAVFDTDAKSMETMEWLFQHMKDDTISYGGSLPKGQGVDALFYAQQLASVQMGRWILPNLKKLKFAYDIAPYPSEDGKSFAPVNIPVAAMGVNSKAKDPEAAQWFATRYVSPEGQKARLSGGGNAVPSIPGAEDVVTEGGLPEHASYWNEVAKTGYAIPQGIATKASVASNINAEIDKVIKSGADAKTFATKICAFINEG
ncbi:extracellular solute-binding protein [Microlunatus capsulatus]|uniref:Multiple sugar transport system substrate-binding protein n=1 Tax=Microlunatus capsulatus TaxID=99117 RepID=A0ABS4Z3H3_9ACTN|nr:extracellular solute-binding protein [Microlunatus capsulatus]MBP2415529.1 multiple sugar transport system substrate-binding protein [Microlunatus capsulatus]